MPVLLAAIQDKAIRELPPCLTDELVQGALGHEQVFLTFSILPLHHICRQCFVSLIHPPHLSLDSVHSELGLNASILDVIRNFLSSQI